MKPNSNMIVTGYTVNPTSQEISTLEVNGEAVSTGSADLEDNKAATIDVSTYTQPVEVTPTEGKDGMEKATITLSNIPVVSDIETYGLSDNEHPDWTNISGFAFMPSDKTQDGYAVINGSSGWQTSTATWNEDFTRIAVSEWQSYNFTLVDSSFFE